LNHSSSLQSYFGFFQWLSWYPMGRPSTLKIRKKILHQTSWAGYSRGQKINQGITETNQQKPTDITQNNTNAHEQHKLPNNLKWTRWSGRVSNSCLLQYTYACPLGQWQYRRKNQIAREPIFVRNSYLSPCGWTHR
jgi:hypothetical protein